MSIIANGITLPTNGDYLQVNGVLVDRVIANGVTVWEKQKIEPFYVIQNGALVSGNYLNAEMNKQGFGFSDCPYGFRGHTGGGKSNAYIYVVFNTRECTNLKISGIASCWSNGKGITLSVTGYNSVLIAENGTGEGTFYEKKFTVAKNSDITIKIETAIYEGIEAWYTLNIKNIYLS